MEGEEVRIAMFTLEVSREELMAHCQARAAAYRTKAEANLARATALREKGAGELTADFMKLLADAMAEEGADPNGSMPPYGMGAGFNRAALEAQTRGLIGQIEARAKYQRHRAQEFAYYANHLPVQKAQLLRFDEIDRLELAGEPMDAKHGIGGGGSRYFGAGGF